MRRARMAYVAAGLAAGLAAAGCLPNRVGLSPDGRTMYFSLGPQGPFGGGDRSNLYSLEIETAEMQALTDGPGAKTWCMPAYGAKDLAYMELVGGDGEGAIRLLDLETGRDVPLTGMLQPHLYPWAIPGGAPRLLAIRKGADAEPYWALYGEKGAAAALPLPDGATAVMGNVGVARDRFAVAVSKDVKVPGDAEGAEKEAHEYLVFLVNCAGEAAEGTQVARWVFDDEPIVDLAFSDDGSRLVAAVLHDPAEFYELDVTDQVAQDDSTGRAEPKRLFECPKAYYPQAAAGGGVVYLRASAADEEWREVALWTPGEAEARVLARLPGKLGQAYTTWRWMEDGRLRVYHLSNEGVRIIETSADGSAATGKRLTGEHLMALARMADFGRAAGKMPSLSEGEWPADVAGPIGVVAEHMKKQFEESPEEIRKASESAEAAAAVWEDVPAVPEIAAPAAESPAAEKPAEAPEAVP